MCRKYSKKFLFLLLLTTVIYVAVNTTPKKHSMYSEQEAYTHLTHYIDSVIKDHALPIPYNELATIKNQAHKIIHKKALYPRLKAVVFIKDVELVKQEFDRYIQATYPDFFEHNNNDSEEIMVAKALAIINQEAKDFFKAASSSSTNNEYTKLWKTIEKDINDSTYEKMYPNNEQRLVMTHQSMLEIIRFIKSTIQKMLTN